MSGCLGKSDLPIDTETPLYTVPAGKTACVNLNLCNRGATAHTVSIAISTGSSVEIGDYLEYETLIPAKGVLERTGLAMSAGETLIVKSKGGELSARAHGFEENL